jgi:tetratricopeptide (TPR) repeat protein
LLTREKQIRIAAIIAIILLLGALVLILDRFPDWQQSRWIVALGIFASITSPIAVYEFLARRSHDPRESGGKSGKIEVQTGQSLEIRGNQQGIVTQHDQSAQTVEGPQTNIGNVQGNQFSGPISTVNLSAAAKSTALVSPWQIPLPPKDFTGRSKNIDDILADFERGATITGLRGMGGIGKTALSLVLAQRLKDRFPDGQIFIDLKGTSEKPLAASGAMEQVIRAHLGSDARTPEDEAELAGLYRSILKGKQTLLLLDNAASREQVEPLLPPEYCCVLVTSRKKFALSGLKPWDLDPLSPEDARELLLAIDPQIGGNANRLAELCGYLPITLKAAAYLLVEMPDLAPEKYIEELGDERTRLKQLGRSGEDLDAEACFGLSYSRLPAETSRVFRLLSVFPADFDAEAEEVICQDEGHRILSELVRWSLVEYQRQSPEREGRYHLHDLLKLFAAGKQEEDGGANTTNKAMLRHAEHYGTILKTANEIYKNGNVLAALMKFDLERKNIEAGWIWAKNNFAERDAAFLSSAYLDWPYLLDLRMHPKELILWMETALSAARQMNDCSMERVHLGNLGTAYSNLGEPRKAIDFYDQALKISREIGDRLSEGAVLGNLGTAYHYLGELRKAIDFYNQALKISQEIGDRRSEGNLLGNLGLAYYHLGEPRKSINFYDQALKISREIGDRRGEGNLLGNVGLAYYDLGEPRKAIDFYDQALKISREIGDRRGEGNRLSNLGLAYYDLGEPRKAIDFYDQALKITREIGNLRSEGGILGNLGLVYWNLGDPRKAIDFYEQQLAIARKTEDRRGEGTALWNMSLSLDELANRNEAIECAKAALKIREEIEDPNAEKVRRKLQEWGSR